MYQGCHLNLPTSFKPAEVIPHLRRGPLSVASQRRQLDLLQRMNVGHQKERGAESLLDARIASFEMAYRIQTAAPEAFAWQKEPEKVQAMYRVKGEMNPFAMNCLLARRLVERGVRVVQIYHGAGQPWDTHGDNDNQHRRLAGDSDRAIAGLLGDLEQRGLLDETLVLWGGEFGRTPASQGNNGRDHNTYGFSYWLAGGGLKGGCTHGDTDEFGHHAVTDAVSQHDFHATLLHLFGLDPTRLAYTRNGQEQSLLENKPSRVVREIVR